MTVDELIKELSKIEDKTKEVEIPEHYTEGYYRDVKWIEEFDWGVRLVN